MTVAPTNTHARTEFPIPASRLGMWVFLSTVTMLFAAFCSAYLVRRATGDWNRVDLPDVLWLNTLILAASSCTLAFARAAKESSRRRLLLCATAVLGVLFLAGQVFAWNQLAQAGIYVPTTPHSSFFYIFTGLHGLHLVGGIVFLLSVTVSELRGRRAEDGRHRLVELVSTYWHYMGGLWAFLLIFLTFF